MMRKAPRTATALGSGILVAALLLSSCASGGGGGGATASPAGTPSAATLPQADIDKAMTTPTTLTFWTWVPNITDEVAMFQKKYPAITVNVENVGNGPAQNTKIRTALQAGSGAPDVVQMRYQDISSFTVTKSLLDLAPYGASDLKGDYVDWVWNQVSAKGQVFGIPQDSGPMGNLYRDDILTSAGVSQPPATWDDYATAAATVKAKTGSYISNLAPNDASQMLGLLWQAGVKPFAYDGEQTVGVALNGDVAKKVVAYWQKLIQADLISVDPDYTDQWYQGLAAGKYAGWITAAWGPVFLQGTAASTSGKWRAAELPQWAAGEHKSGNWGGSADAVLKSTKNPIAAYELAKWLNNDKSSATEFTTKQLFFPTLKSVLSDPAFVGLKSDFYGGQAVNQVFAKVSETVDVKFEWLPYMDFAASSYKETLGKAISDKGDLTAGLDAWQKALVDYGTQQGFTVK